ncbi:MAG: hypothetical protein EOP06_29105, partial [Proteobacteria bacterium]
MEAREVMRIQKQANDVLKSVESDLGRYYAGERTDFQAVRQGLDIAGRAKPLLEGSFQSERFLQVLTGEVTTPELLMSVPGRYQQACQHFDSLLSSLHAEIPIFDLMDVIRLQELGKKLEQLQEPVVILLGSSLRGWDTNEEHLEKTAQFIERLFTLSEQLGKKDLSPSLIEILTTGESPLRIALEEAIERSSRCEATWSSTKDEWANLIPLDDLKEGRECQQLRQSLEIYRPRLDALFGRFSKGIETEFEDLKS